MCTMYDGHILTSPILYQKYFQFFHKLKIQIKAITSPEIAPEIQVKRWETYHLAGSKKILFRSQFCF